MSVNKQREQVQKVQVCFIVAVDKLITHATGNAEASLSLMRCFFLLAIREKSTNEKQTQREATEQSVDSVQVQICYNLHYDTPGLQFISTAVTKLQVCYSSVLAPTHSAPPAPSSLTSGAESQPSVGFVPPTI